MQKMQKLIRNHQWITKPNLKGISYYGLTNWSKIYFSRLINLTHQYYPRSRYGQMFKYRIGDFLQRLKYDYKFKTETQLYNNLSTIPLSERMQYNRFCIRQDQPFTKLQTVQFDVQLTAPLDMRVIQLNYQCYYFRNIYNSDWLYKVQILSDNGYDKLVNQTQYQKMNKVIQCDGLFL